MDRQNGGEMNEGEFYTWRTNLKGTQMDREMIFKKSYFQRYYILLSGFNLKTVLYKYVLMPSASDTVSVSYRSMYANAVSFHP